MDIILLPTEGYASNSYLLVSSGEGAVIDPSGSLNDILSALSEYGAVLKYIILTHGHFDHMLTLRALREETKAKLCIHKFDAPNLKDSDRSLFSRIGHPEAVFDDAEILLEDADTLPLGDEIITVLHTPGHTPGSVMQDFGGDLISGDTLFDMSVGRSDFIGGDSTALINSIFKIYDKYPNARFYPGHGPASTIDKQIKYNPFTKQR